MNSLLVKDADYMQLALGLAREAQDDGEIPVGAVVVLAGKIVGRGRNRTIADHDVSGHAEIVALRDAGARVGNHRLAGATIYVTLEPCTMCAGAMLHARVERLAYGARDPQAGAAGGRFDTLLIDDYNHRVQVDGGILEAESAALLKHFFAARR